MPSAGGAGPLVQWDQRNDGPTAPAKGTFDSVSGSFTPALSALDTVRLCVASGSTADLQVTISAGGSEVGTSTTETTVAVGRNNPLPMTFTFASPVSLTPGDTYTIDGVVGSGVSIDQWAFMAADVSTPFNIWDHTGLWYQEGLAGGVDPAAAASYAAAPTCAPPNAF